MDYQKKYLKYKFKYSNLLNQYGGYNGGITKEYYRAVFNEYKAKSRYLPNFETNELSHFVVEITNPETGVKTKEKLLDPITGDFIYWFNALYIDTYIYDANILSDYIQKEYLEENKLATNPVNRNLFTKEIYDSIMVRLSGDTKIRDKKTDIINQIKNLIQLEEDLQKKILYLEPEQRKILLSDDKFKIFITFDYNTRKKLIEINRLLLKAIKTFENNEVIILLQFNENIQKEILSLKPAIPEQQNIIDDDGRITINKQIDDQTRKNLKDLTKQFLDNLQTILKEFTVLLYNTYITDESRILVLMPKKYMTNEIIKLAVQKDGLALRYVPDHIKTLENCLIAYKNNNGALRYVPDELQTYIRGLK